MIRRAHVAVDLAARDAWQQRIGHEHEIACERPFRPLRRVVDAGSRRRRAARVEGNPRIDERRRVGDRRQHAPVRIAAERAVEIAADDRVARLVGRAERPRRIFRRRGPVRVGAGLSVPIAQRIDLREPLARRIVFEVRRDDPQWARRRHQLDVELVTPPGPLRVVTTHLEYYSARQRLAQVDALRDRHREACAHADRPAPAENATGPFSATDQPRDAIVCGDFNSAFGSDAYRRMLAPIADAPPFVDAWIALHPGCTPPPTAGVYDTAQWSEGPLACDFVFVTDTLLPRVTRCEIDGDVRASDHQPIVLELD